MKFNICRFCSNPCTGICNSCLRGENFQAYDIGPYIDPITENPNTDTPKTAQERYLEMFLIEGVKSLQHCTDSETEIKVMGHARGLKVFCESYQVKNKNCYGCPFYDNTSCSIIGLPKLWEV